MRLHVGSEAAAHAESVAPTTITWIDPHSSPLVVPPRFGQGSALARRSEVGDIDRRVFLELF